MNTAKRSRNKYGPFSRTDYWLFLGVFFALEAHMAPLKWYFSMISRVSKDFSWLIIFYIRWKSETFIFSFHSLSFPFSSVIITIVFMAMKYIYVTCGTPSQSHSEEIFFLSLMLNVMRILWMIIQNHSFKVIKIYDIHFKESF